MACDDMTVCVDMYVYVTVDSWTAVIARDSWHSDCWLQISDCSTHWYGYRPKQRRRYMLLPTFNSS